MKQISFALYRSLHYLGDAPRSIKSDGVFLQERELGKEEDLRLLRRGILGERLEDTQQTMKNMIAQCKNAAEILFLLIILLCWKRKLELTIQILRQLSMRWGYLLRLYHCTKEFVYMM